MAFPSNIGTKRDDLSAAWMLARNAAGAVKQRAQSLRDLSAAGTAGASNILNYATFLADARFELQRAAAVPGIGAYAQQQVNDPALNLAAEFSAMTTQIDACLAWVVASFPKDGGGYLLAQTISADGRPVDRIFTAAQTVAFRAALDTLIGTVD